jgi:hypothetical protein
MDDKLGNKLGNIDSELIIKYNDNILLNINFIFYYNTYKVIKTITINDRYK